MKLCAHVISPEILNFCEGLFSRNFVDAKFVKIQPSQYDKITHLSM